jgi:aminoglycoside phosphotransferase (APT) family kinase protein
MLEALAQVPGYAPGTASVQVTPLAGGSVNRSYQVQTPSGCFVLRLSSGTDAWLASDRLVERALHRIAASVGIAPRIAHADWRDRWLITEFVPGRLWGEADFAARESLAHLGDTLRRLHCLPTPDCGRFELLEALDGYVRRIEGAGESPTGLAGCLEQAAAAWRISGAQDRTVAVLHHDLHGSNLIQSERGLVLIDWECAAVADPLLDIACILSYYDAARAYAPVLLQHAGLGTVTSAQLAAAVWLFDLHTFLWYWERRLRRAATALELAAEGRLRQRVARGVPNSL